MGAVSAIAVTMGFYAARRVWSAHSARVIAERGPEIIRECFGPRLPAALQDGLIERVEEGRNSIVFRIRPHRGDPVYAHLWQWSPPRSPSRERRDISDLFARTGLNVPRTIVHDDSLYAMRRWGIMGLVETAAQGLSAVHSLETLPTLTDPIARDLAALHAQTGRRWGKPWRPVNPLSCLRRDWTERLGKFRACITPKTSRLDASFITSGLNDLERRLRAMPSQTPRLVHGDVHHQNLFLCQKGAITWIDFGAAHYGLPEQDISAARKLFPKPEHFAIFLEDYAHAAGRLPDPEHIFTMELLQRWRHLYSAIRKVEKRTGQGRDPDLLRQHNAERWIMKVLEAGPAMDQDFTPEVLREY